MIVNAKYIFYNLSINEVTSTIENIQREQFNKYGFNDKYTVTVICHTEYDLKSERKPIIWRDYYLLCPGIREITSTGRCKKNRVNKLIVILEG